ncbi:MAG: hypothetical protein KDK37_05020 [Leptospiraceae bacterium]|nr:hypothetical protein [Leptospiraceae bacterium]
MKSVLSYLPGYPLLDESELQSRATREEMEELLFHSRARLESVELLGDTALRDSRLLAEYLLKDLEHLQDRLESLESAHSASPNKSGRLSFFGSLMNRLRPSNPEHLDALKGFSRESDPDRSANLQSALRESAARLDHLERRWKALAPDYFTSEDRYARRLKRIVGIILAVALLAGYAGYRIHRNQPQERFYRKHLAPLQAVLPPETFSRLTKLAQENSEDFLRVEDLLKIRVGLDTFQSKRGHYPGSTGAMFQSGSSRDQDWIPDLRKEVPVAIPLDRRPGSHPENQYLYITNGADYKLLAPNPENCESVKKWVPEMIDPVRGCAAIGYWTENGAQF